MKACPTTYRKRWVLFIVLLSFLVSCSAVKIKESYVGLGWASNSVNTVIFRSSAVTTFKDYQFTSYYNQNGKMVLAKRLLGSDQWELQETQYSGNIKDAHNTICIAVDTQGFLHVSWGQHDSKLNYARSTKPLGLELTEKLTMTGLQEEKVTYPEFHNLPSGKLLFCYRSGASGRGNMVIDEYDPITKSWSQLQNNLLDGQDQRSAYWQMAIGKNGAIYLSWVWRETWDVATNHDICFAVSHDGGVTWQKSTGETYELPITESKAEVIWKVPQNSNLINQTSMTVGDDGNPYIATYWNNSKAIPEYKVVFQKNNTWQLINTDFHKNPFQLSGGGTKRIPISRPKILVDDKMIYLLYRDEEQNNKMMMAYASINKKEWKQLSLTDYDVGQWEPNYDAELWKAQKELHIFSQKVTQVDSEGLADNNPQPVKIIEITKMPKQ